VNTRIWVHSDLQLSQPTLAEATLSRAVDDLLGLRLSFDAVWCLGDALGGKDIEALEEIAKISVAQIRRVNAPLYYLMGNHELDAFRKVGVRCFPLHRLVREEPGWHAAPLEAFHFTERLGKALIVFLGDHLAEDGDWWSLAGSIQGRAGQYPHTAESYRKLRQMMEDHDGPVIIASHYALPGGQRPSPLLASLLPLPRNVSLFLHGHAHIGDTIFNAENPWQRANPISGETRLQYNISALESVRTPGSHSAILDLVNGVPERLRIRCHEKQEWVEEFPLTATPQSGGCTTASPVG
jgi:calcineurin-like phosphoesterase family protein